MWVAFGIDMFDRVIPTRHARGAVVYTYQGRMRPAARYRRDGYPIDTNCPCYTWESAASTSITYQAGEVLATTLAAIHNITFSRA